MEEGSVGGFPVDGSVADPRHIREVVAPKGHDGKTMCVGSDQGQMNIVIGQAIKGVSKHINLKEL